MHCPNLLLHVCIAYMLSRQLPAAMAISAQGKYADEPFVHVMDAGGVPHTRYVRGTNYAFISVFPDRIPGRAIIISGARLLHSQVCCVFSCWPPGNAW